ncbi:MAG: hypothetical protein A3A86_05520 [Elusimicrobia bacterium RIFCSPLOWO2_01_FULL_60_11]|nr:MAG: hypothetical protein A3A86_05520 [Elusimicrobia bacterium RIFCSPLOWO2_01_FULL_60_11]
MKIKFGLILPLAVFAAQAFWHARDKSATYDEPAHLAISRLISVTEHQDYDVGHPPFIRELFGLPLRFMDPSLPGIPPPEVSESVPLALRPQGNLYVYANLFLYQNRVPADTLLLAARAVSIVLALILGLIIYLFAGKLYGERAGIFSLWMFAFCPNLIAHGSLVTTDMGGVAAAAAFLYSALLYFEKRTALNILACGITLGLALGAKFNNLILPVLFTALVLIRGSDRRAWTDIVNIGFLSWSTLCLLYGFDRVFTPHLFEIPPFLRYLPLPDSFIRGILSGSYHNARGHGAFFMGEYSSGGWKSYFPVAFLLKTPMVTIGLIALALLGAALRPKSLRFEETLLLLPLAALLAFSVNSKLNIGLRHILLAYPLLLIFAGRIAPKKTAVLAAIVAVLALETLSAAPDYLAFFNRAAGGPDKGMRYLSDSNLDWGQDLKGLGRFLKDEGGSEVLLSYFGTAPALAYGIRAQGLPTVWEYPKSGHINSASPKKEFCAVSVTNLQAVYFPDRELYSWLLSREPVKKIGHSIYVYDVTDDLEAQKKFMEIYGRTGEREKYLRQAERVKRLERSLSERNRS